MKMEIIFKNGEVRKLPADTSNELVSVMQRNCHKSECGTCPEKSLCADLSGTPGL
jgi:hypothetical protein